MQLTIKRGRLLLGILAVLIATMALASPSPASASGFCFNQKINNLNKCWGASRVMGLGQAWGLSTGVCVGADLTQGSCAPTLQWAWVGVPQNVHYPWVIGTGSNFTFAEGFTQ
jgi:hypothetical protein